MGLYSCYNRYSPWE